MTKEEKLAKFGEGPWLDEPDRVEFRVHGLPCLIRRHDELGTLCGYVAVPRTHVLHGMQYREVNSLVRLRVHGGVNYSKPCEDDVCHVPRPGEPDDVWWFGFHCSYGWDYCPVYGPWLRRDGGVEDYRDLPYVRQHTERLALQLAAARL